MSENYLEVHVNVEPFHEEDVDFTAAAVAEGAKHGFRRGKLLMAKGGPAPDAFFTWRGTDVADAEASTRAFVQALQELGVTVLRYKLEITLVDSREADRWELFAPCGDFVEDKFSRATCVRKPRHHKGKHQAADGWEWD